MELFNQLELSKVDLYINIALLPNCFSTDFNIFVNRIKFINNYLKFKEREKDFPGDLFCCHGKIKNKIIRFLFNYFPLYNQRYYELGNNLYRRLKHNQKYIFLIFYDSGWDFERSKGCISLVKKFYIENDIQENPILILIRYNYQKHFNSNEKINLISDEEALEYADKNNIYFTHISSTEKNETGIKELLYTVLIKYISNEIK